MKRLKYLKKRGYRVCFTDLPTKILGACDTESRIVAIDPILHFVDTFLHEYLHARYPKLSERKIEDMTYRVRMRMTRKEIDQLAKAVWKEAVTCPKGHRQKR